MPTRIDTLSFRGKTYYVKRDDLIDECLSGNKYRKLYSLLQLPNTTYDTVISYGGAQSNAMYSIACMCKKKGWVFHYYTKTLPQHLKETPEGNFQKALALGMILHEIPHQEYNEVISTLASNEKTYLLRQGGADELAKEGLTFLAQEITSFKEEQNIDELCVVLPSGTGTSALYLQQALNDRVYTSALVGDETYLQQQWQELSRSPYPTIFPQKTKRQFAKPKQEYLEVYNELKEQGIEFDLIYAPQTWLDMHEYLKDKTVIYVHTGGVSGNKTMLQRYKRRR